MFKYNFLNRLRRSSACSRCLISRCCASCQSPVWSSTTSFYVIVLTPLVMAGMIIVAGVVRAAYRPEKRDQISYIHSSLLLLLSFLVLPATSMKVRERCVGQLVLTIVEDHATRSR